MPVSLQVLRFSDGRRGHDNQSLGLIDALRRLRPLDVRTQTIDGGISGALGALTRASDAMPVRLVVGAGHATHLALLVAARRLRARSVVLMNPSLPRALFDLCIVPRHDDVRESGNVLTSLGALNRMRPGGPRDPHMALILVGGPSRHHHWNDATLRGQVIALVDTDPALDWHLAGSPRTPATTLAGLSDIGGLRITPFDAAPPDWLAQQLARTSRVWVTEDSVSMAYEAASCGAPTGLLEVPPVAASNRVRAAVAMLLDAGFALSFDAWREGQPLAAPPRPLQEAERCARALLERWPDLA